MELAELSPSELNELAGRLQSSELRLGCTLRYLENPKTVTPFKGSRIRETQWQLERIESRLAELELVAMGAN